MISAPRIAVVVVALALGTTILVADIAGPEQVAVVPAAPESGDWVTVTGQQVTECTRGTCSGTTTMSDPRLDGETLITFQALTERGSASGDYALWGTAVLINDEGSWSGQWMGFVDREGVRHVTTWLQGAGGFEGLSYLEQGSGPQDLLNVTGLIYSGEIPPTVVPAAVADDGSD